MKTRMIGVAALLVAATGCSVPFVGGSDGPDAEQRRARCDQMAAGAIDTEDLAQARRLAARAAECYAAEAQRS